MSYSGISPKNPTDYKGISNGVVPAVTRARRPTSADWRQPETGKRYPITCIWQVSKSPTTGSEGELWLLSKIVSNVATWVQLGSGGGGGGLASLTAQNTTTVLPSGAGDITVNGSVVATGTNSGFPLYAKGTESDPTHDIDYEIQLAGLVTATPANSNSCGIACFNDTQFQKDATSGMISLVGSTTSPPIIMFSLDDTNNATADGSGVVTLKGQIVNNGTHAKSLFSLRSPGTNDILFDLQVATLTTDAAKSVTKAGVISANSAQFQMDATTGFLSLKGSTSLAPILSLTGSGGGGALSPDANGNVTIAGSGGATVTGSGNTITINAGGAGGGLTWREETGTSATFAIGGEGIFGNNALPITLTLPSATVGDTFAAYQEGAGRIRIAQNASDQIRFGNSTSTSGAGGYIDSLNQGDCVWIVCLEANKFRVINSIGSWVVG